MLEYWSIASWLLLAIKALSPIEATTARSSGVSALVC